MKICLNQIQGKFSDIKVYFVAFTISFICLRVLYVYSCCLCIFAPDLLGFRRNIREAVIRFRQLLSHSTFYTFDWYMGYMERVWLVNYHPLTLEMVEDQYDHLIYAQLADLNMINKVYPTELYTHFDSFSAWISYIFLCVLFDFSGFAHWNWEALALSKLP